MTTVNIKEFNTLKQEQIDAQSKVPHHSFDWNIYQGRIDLLKKVESLFDETILIAPPIAMTTSKSKIDKTILQVAEEVVGEQG